MAISLYNHTNDHPSPQPDAKGTGGQHETMRSCSTPLHLLVNICTVDGACTHLPLVFRLQRTANISENQEDYTGMRTIRCMYIHQMPQRQTRFTSFLKKAKSFTSYKRLDTSLPEVEMSDSQVRWPSLMGGLGQDNIPTWYRQDLTLPGHPLSIIQTKRQSSTISIDITIGVINQLPSF